MKSYIKKSLAILAMFALVFTVYNYISPELAHASTSNSWTQAGITADGSPDSSGIFKDLKKLVTIVMVFGGFWILICLVVGGILLAGSGHNPQRRTSGLVFIAFTFIGGWIMMKAYSIAGFIAGFGS